MTRSILVGLLALAAACSSSTEPPAADAGPGDSCHPLPGVSGNELGVGGFCTPGMGECAANGVNGASACAIDLDPEGSAMCIKVGCQKHDQCGAGACCYGRATGPRACIPKECTGVTLNAPCPDTSYGADAGP